MNSIRTLVVLAAVFLWGCSRDAVDQSFARDGMWRVDYAAKTSPEEWGSFSKAFRAFHEALAAKDWEVTYNYRTEDFRSSVGRDHYIASMRQRESAWELVDFEVLSLNMRDRDTVEVVIRYIERPGPKESHVVVTWEKENDYWGCVEAGPNLLPLFRGVR